MNYDSQRIQPKRWTIPKPEEVGIIQAEHGEGETCKSRATYYECIQCGTVKKRKSTQLNHFCTSWCSQLFSMSKWLNCSICHAKIGLGCVKSSQLLNRSSVSAIWKKRGIVAARPENKSWFVVAKKEKTKEKKLYNEYEKAWVSEINRDNKAFVDWSYIWDKEKAKSTAKKNYSYSSWDEEKRKAYNLRCLINQKKRWESDPLTKIRDRAKSKKWRESNIFKIKEKMDKWNSLNKHKLREYAKRARLNPKNKHKFNLRRRFRDLMKATKNGGHISFSSTIGCSTKYLSSHLESQFTKHMTWDNYGSYWHVDHIIPCAKFDHSIPSQVAQCWHWTNLRPLEAKANIAKSDSITKPQMSLLLNA